MLLPLSLSLLLLVPSALCDCADRSPTGGVDSDAGDGDGGFYLAISGEPNFYQPGNLYTVTLRVRNETKRFFLNCLMYILPVESHFTSCLLKDLPIWEKIFIKSMYNLGDSYRFSIGLAV